MKLETAVGQYVDIALVGQPVERVAHGRARNLKVPGDFRLAVDFVKFQLPILNHVEQAIIGDSLQRFIFQLDNSPLCSGQQPIPMLRHGRGSFIERRSLIQIILSQITSIGQVKLGNFCKKMAKIVQMSTSINRFQRVSGVLCR